MVTAFAPGKCILFGEHAVVYGQPAVAISIDAGVEVTISESDRWILRGCRLSRPDTPIFLT